MALLGGHLVTAELIQPWRCQQQCITSAHTMPTGCCYHNELCPRAGSSTQYNSCAPPTSCCSQVVGCACRDSDARDTQAHIQVWPLITILLLLGMQRCLAALEGQRSTCGANGKGGTMRQQHLMA